MMEASHYIWYQLSAVDAKWKCHLIENLYLWGEQQFPSLIIYQAKGNSDKLTYISSSISKL